MWVCKLTKIKYDSNFDSSVALVTSPNAQETHGARGHHADQHGFHSIVTGHSVGLHCPESFSDPHLLPSSLPFSQRQHRVVMEGVGSGVSL